MTLRTVRESRQAPDFTRLTSAEARRRVQQLVRQGFPEYHAADLFGWSVTDVRRALAERSVGPQRRQ
ncbi:MAG: hypothetical protein ACRD3Q_20785 [Terriglobales bacterium]